MRLVDANAYKQRARANARAAAAEAADAAHRADQWLRALHTDRHVLDAARRAVLATRLLADLTDPDNGLNAFTDDDYRHLQETP